VPRMGSESCAENGEWKLCEEWKVKVVPRMESGSCDVKCKVGR